MAKIDIFKFVKETDSFAAGETIFQKGSPGDTMCVVQEGEVHILVGDQVVETIGPGGIVGEMSLIDPGQERSATAVANTDCRVVTLNEEEFLNHVHRTPFFALQVMRIMAARLRNMNAQAGGD